MYSFEFNIENSRDLYKILSVNIDGKWKCIGSKYNQQREIDKFLSATEGANEKTVFIIFGLCFGEHIRELLKKRKNNKILIIDINKEWTRYAKQNTIISDLLKIKNVKIANDDNEIIKFFEKNINEYNIYNIMTINYSNYDKVYNEKLVPIYKTIRDCNYKVIISKNTIEYFGDLWLDGFLNSLKYISKGTHINKLKNKYENIPAIIVSAGPSLEKNIKELKNVNGAFILSGGRTLRSLLEIGVKPDCLVVVDGTEASFKLVENYIDKINCPLLLEESTNIDVIKNHKGEKIFSISNECINEIFNEKSAVMVGGGSVAHTMTNFAAHMGCNPIIFIGQDLAYTNNKSHAECAKTLWAKTNYKDYIEKDTDIYVNDIYGEPIRTDIILNTFRNEMEKIIKIYPHIKFINATEGGANINGTEIKTLKETLEDLQHVEILNMNMFLSKEDKSEQLKFMLKDNIIKFKNIKAKCEEGTRELKKFKSAYISNENMKLNKSIKKLDRIDAYIQENINLIDMLKNVLFEVVYNIENNEEFLINLDDDYDLIFKKQFKKNREIYNLLIRNIESIIPKLEKVLNEF